MIAKPLNTNDMIATATGLATVSGPSTSMAGRRGGASSSLVMIYYMGYLTQNFFAMCLTLFRTLAGGRLTRGLLDKVRVMKRGSDTISDTICRFGVFLGLPGPAPGGSWGPSGI